MSSIDAAKISSSYRRDGYCFPLRIMDKDRAAAYRAQLEAMGGEFERRKLGHRSQLNHMHVAVRFASEIVRNERLLDIVEAIIGPDILVWGSTFFIKEPRSKGFISWHQDLRYWGLADADAMVSAWLALGPVNRANGCMRFVTGSHRLGLTAHEDRFDEDNFLYRGQSARVDIDEDDVVHVELEPGEISLHHGFLLHASAPNRSDERRVGYTINFIAPHNRQVVAPRDFAMLVRGEDRYGHFEAVPPPAADFSDEAMTWHARVLAAQDLATYDGTAGPT